MLAEARLEPEGENMAGEGMLPPEASPEVFPLL